MRSTSVNHLREERIEQIAEWQVAMMRKPITCLQLPQRTLNALQDDNIEDIEGLLTCTPEELLALPQFGQKTLQTILDALAELGFTKEKTITLDQLREIRRMQAAGTG